MKMKAIGATLVIAALATGCGEGESEEATDETITAAAEPAETVADTEATEPEPVAAEAPEAEAAANIEAPAEGETTTLLALREGFAADSDAWMGRTVTVQAQFMSATSAGGSLNNVSLVVNEEDYAEDRLAHSMMCAFGDDAPESVDLTQYDEITVRGTVVERFGRAGLSDCEIIEQ